MADQQFHRQRSEWSQAPSHTAPDLSIPPQRPSPPPNRHEQLDDDRIPRPIWAPLFERLGRLTKSDFKRLHDRMAATMREMDVTFNAHAGPQRVGHRQKPWDCDLIPHIFDPEEWALAARGIDQRLRAFEHFLKDVYGEREILRAGVVPLRPILGSPAYLHAALGVPPSGGNHLHFCGTCLTRDSKGRLAVKSHFFTRGSGISYMIQNRRILSRVNPDIFGDMPVASISETPVQLLSLLQGISPPFEGEFTAVLLTPGPRSSSYSEHSFLARRMGLLLAQGGDLIVLDDKVYLKSVGGLERVEAIYNRLSHQLLDPLVCRRDSLVGVPGLVNCLRRGTVAMMNSFGSELADDRAILPFSNAIIRFYLGESPILPTLPTFWMGDIDQREMVLADLPSYRIWPLFGEDILGNWRGLPPSPREAREVRAALRKNPQGFVAQPCDEGGITLVYKGSQREERTQDHVIFALRDGDRFKVVPGALTRVSAEPSMLTSFKAGGSTKDTWVLLTGDSTQEHSATPNDRALEIEDDRRAAVINRQITSRIAEAFYWLGRYLERLNSLAFMIQVIESLEIEEINAAERRHYRPIWGRLLPPIEGAPSGAKRSIGSRVDRYLLLLKPDSNESAIGLVNNALRNARSIQDSLSPESWVALAELRDTFARPRFQPNIDEGRAAAVTRSLAEAATRLVPQFFGIADSTLLADEGRHLCGFGQHLERAIITANAIHAIHPSLQAQLQRGREAEHATEIELSAFLRLLGSRDAYRKIYQMRARPIPVLELLYQNPEAPRAICYCLNRCAGYLRQPSLAIARGAMPVLEEIETLLVLINRINWAERLKPARTEGGEERPFSLNELLGDLYKGVAAIHDCVTDSFLSHQAHISSIDAGWETL